MNVTHITRAAGIAVFGAFAVACSDSTGGDARVRIQLSDAPSDIFASAVVDIGRIELIRAGGSAVVLTQDGGTHDLLELQNGVTADLASLDIESGRYLQLRLIVTGATVTLASGLTFSDGSTSRALTVPSGAQSGIKINLRDGGNAGIELVDGETIFVVDFDVSQNFVIQGNIGTPAGITGVTFTPLVRASVRDIAGSIAGTVTLAGAALADATVRATLTNPGTMEALETDEATAVTAADGTYRIWFLAPGTYNVTVDGRAGTQSVVVAEGQAVTGISFAF